jgi:hypothetical protein
MEFIKWVDGLSKGVKLVLAIFLPIIFMIYRVIKDATANKILFVLLDIFLGIVGWVMDIVNILTDKPLFAWGSVVSGDGTIDVDATDKKEEKPADAKAEEKPAEEKPAEEKPAEEKKDETK